jgi:hypothetical protein
MPITYHDLEKDSPNLSGKLKRKFQVIPEECKKAYFLASKLGGNIELDFIREEGVSFNPRAARIGVILTEGLPNITIEQITLGILSTLLNRETLEDKAKSFDLSQISSHLSEYYQEKFLTLYHYFQNLRKNSIDITPMEKEEEIAKLSQILISLFIDNIRHVHLASIDCKKERIECYLKRAKTYQAISKKYLPYYTPFIQRWVDRNNN